MKTLFRLLGFLRSFLDQVALSVLLGVATIASNIGLMGTSAYLISFAALHPSIAYLEVAIVGVRFFGIARGVFRYLERLVSHSANFKLLANLRTWFYERLEPLAPARLQIYKSGDLLSRAVMDIDTLENFYVRVVSPIIVALVVTVGMSWFIGGFNPLLTPILAGGLLISGIALPLFIYIAGRKPSRQMVTLRAEMSGQMVDDLLGMSDLLAYQQEPEVLARLAELSKFQGRAQMRLALAGGAGSALSSLLSNLTLWAVLVTTIPLVSSGRLDGILLAVVVLLTMASFEAVQPLPQAAQNLESSLEAADRLFSLADSTPAVSEPPEPLAVSKAPAIAIAGLSFRYEEGLSKVLDDINLELPFGKHVAVVGPSGAGKSTLLNLLLRFWDYGEGSILLDGRELRDFSGDDVRQHVSVISQSTHLFAATLKQNLLLAKPAADEAQLQRVLESVELSEWQANLPEGLDTWLGEGGVKMSGGERQRLAIAQALLKDAPILYLDEPTSNLDATTERKLLTLLDEVMRNKSVLWVTHRLAGLEKADEIVVLEGGKIVERGRHADLLARQGAYAAMWLVQHNILQ
ncbi:MAG TPA: thiol reductant ABC exporter subunit CydC [Longilinea sp.]|nr:thiol reductant ABC exporter subunit CydC [Longilinea sp.]